MPNPAMTHFRNVCAIFGLWFGPKGSETQILDNLGNLNLPNADGLRVNGVITPQFGNVEGVVPGATAATASNYGAFFIADAAYQVVAVREMHQTAGTDAGAVNLNVEKLTGVQAPGAGVVQLTDNASAGVNLKAAANTVVSGALSGVLANLQLAAGDRLSLKLTGTPTSLANVLVQVTLKRI